MRYTSTGLEGEPVAVSGVVMAPAEPRDRPGGPRPVLAPPTAPRASFAIATDYPGLGTPGQHRPRSRSSASPRAATPRCSPVLAIDVTADGRWAARLAENTPACGIGVPLLVTQGEADTIVLPCTSPSS